VCRRLLTLSSSGGSKSNESVQAVDGGDDPSSLETKLSRKWITSYDYCTVDKMNSKERRWVDE
jgi:hypothetical protein